MILMNIQRKTLIKMFILFKNSKEKWIISSETDYPEKKKKIIINVEENKIKHQFSTNFYIADYTETTTMLSITVRI